MLRRKIRNQISNFGVGSSVTDLSITISNYTGVTLRFREAKLILEGDGTSRCEMQFTGELKTGRPISRREIWRVRKRLKKGEQVHVETVICGPKKMESMASLDDDGCVVVRPFMAATFRVPISALLIHKMNPMSALVLVEFTNCSGIVELLEVRAKRSSGESIQKQQARNLEDYKSGRLDEVRKMFGLPPIEIATSVPKTDAQVAPNVVSPPSSGVPN